MMKSKSSAIISLLLVFLSGALVGAVAHRLYMVNTVSSNGINPQPPPRRDPEEVRRHLVAETKEKVKLDDEQVRKLNELYDQERQEFDRLHQKWNAEGRTLRASHMDRIKAILRPDQVPLFEQLQAEREKEHRRRQQQNEKK